MLAASAAAEVPLGPRLALMREAPSGQELLTVDQAGEAEQRIAGRRTGSVNAPAPIFGDPSSWSADGSSIVFAGVAGPKHHRRLDLYRASADGTRWHRIADTRGGFNPVFSPNGHTLAFARERQANGFSYGFSLWLLDLRHGPARQVSPWRKGLFEFPSSFSPDGSTLAVTRKAWKGNSVRYSVLAMKPGGGGATVLLRNGAEAVYSPDGTRLALLATGKERFSEGLGFTPTELAVANADGSGLTLLTHTPGLEQHPGWDPSGARLAYTRTGSRGFAILGFHDSVMEINPDGTCPTRILSASKIGYYDPAWQPGPGRGAGPIAC